MKRHNPFTRSTAHIVEYARVRNLSIADAADQYITQSHWHRTAELIQDYRAYLKLCQGKSLDEIARLTNGE